jgi:hypothetical protein
MIINKYNNKISDKFVVLYGMANDTYLKRVCMKIRLLLLFFTLFLGNSTFLNAGGYGVFRYTDKYQGKEHP